MRRFFILVKFIFLFMLTVTTASASENLLNTVILEGIDKGYNITLKADAVSKVKKISESNDKLTLVLSGISAASTVDVIYKDTSTANSLIVENSGWNDIKIHIKAENIINSNVIFDIPASAPVFVKDSSKNENLAFNLFAIGLVLALGILVRSFISEKHTEASLYIPNMKDRELELYRSTSRLSATDININSPYKKSYATNSLQHNNILKGKTIRNLQSLVNK